jgi:hypothetical protein
MLTMAEPNPDQPTIRVVLWEKGRALLARLRKPKPNPLTLCPGPMRPRTRLLPHRWFFRRACFYDLTGLEPDEEGLITCPECGRRAPLHTALHTHRRWRPVRITVAIALLLFAASMTPFFRTGQWVAYLPDTALVAIERAGKSVQSDKMKRELDDRVRTTVLSDRNAAWLAQSLITDLHEDTIRYNAIRAISLLRSLGDPAIPALERALHSTDTQQRQMAASALRQITTYTPTPRMLWVTVEGLRDDDLPLKRDKDHRWNYTFVFNAARGTPYLANHALAAESALAEGLRSDDRQQRYLSAIATGFGACKPLIPLAAPILIEHLADNKYAGDAKWAMPALVHLGTEVRPYIEPLLASQDKQQRQLAELILLELQGPPTTEAQRAHRRKLNTVTHLVEDPMDLNLDHWEFRGLGRRFGK